MASKEIAPAITLTLQPGDFLFKEGESSRDLYIVKTGKMRIFKIEAGVEIELAAATAGYVVGECAAIDDGRRSASCQAVQKSELVVVPVDDFRRVLASIPEWFRKIACILVQRLREVDKKIHRALDGDCIPQVAWLLALMSYLPQMRDGGQGREIPQKMLENEIVDVLQVQLSDVTSALVCLEKDGLIQLEKGRVVVKDAARLEEKGSVIFNAPEEELAI